MQDDHGRHLGWSAGETAWELAAAPGMLAELEARPVPALRWFRIRGPALLLGSSQRLNEADWATAERRGVSIHKRRSGGGAVFSDEALLLMDIALPQQHPLYRADVTESYRWLGEVWVAALAQLGVAAELVSVPHARADTADLDTMTKRVCFGGLSPYEVLADGRKLVGLAQIRRRGGAAYQAGLYLSWHPESTAALIAGAAEEQAALAKNLAQRVVGLAELSDAGAEQVCAAVEAALADHAGLHFRPSGWSETEAAAIEESLPRYRALERPAG